MSSGKVVQFRRRARQVPTELRFSETDRFLHLLEGVADRYWEPDSDVLSLYEEVDRLSEDVRQLKDALRKFESKLGCI